MQTGCGEGVHGGGGGGYFVISDMLHLLGAAHVPSPAPVLREVHTYVYIHIPIYIPFPSNLHARPCRRQRRCSVIVCLFSCCTHMSIVARLGQRPRVYGLGVQRGGGRGRGIYTYHFYVYVHMYILLYLLYLLYVYVYKNFALVHASYIHIHRRGRGIYRWA